MPPAPAGGTGVAVRVRLRKVNAFIATVYMRSAVGTQGNLDLLASLGEWSQGLAAPFLIAGDFNCEPSELSAVGWLRQVGASAVPHEAGAWTCRSSAGLRLLDFGVVANEWAAGSRAEVVQEVQWSLHLASRQYLRGRPRTIEHQLRPRAIPSPMRPLAWTGPANRDLARGTRDEGGSDAHSVGQKLQHDMKGCMQTLEHAALDAADFASDQRGRLPFMGRGSP